MGLTRRQVFSGRAPARVSRDLGGIRIAVVTTISLATLPPKSRRSA